MDVISAQYILRKTETSMHVVLVLDSGLSVSLCETGSPIIDYAFPSLRPLSLPQLHCELWGYRHSCIEVNVSGCEVFVAR